MNTTANENAEPHNVGVSNEGFVGNNDGKGQREGDRPLGEVNSGHESQPPPNSSEASVAKASSGLPPPTAVQLELAALPWNELVARSLSSFLEPTIMFDVMRSIGLRAAAARPSPEQLKDLTNQLRELREFAAVCQVPPVGATIHNPLITPTALEIVASQTREQNQRSADSTGLQAGVHGRVDPRAAQETIPGSTQALASGATPLVNVRDAMMRGEETARTGYTGESTQSATVSLGTAPVIYNTTGGPAAPDVLPSATRDWTYAVLTKYLQQVLHYSRNTPGAATMWQSQLTDEQITETKRKRKLSLQSPDTEAVALATALPENWDTLVDMDCSTLKKWYNFLTQAYYRPSSNDGAEGRDTTLLVGLKKKECTFPYWLTGDRRAHYDEAHIGAYEAAIRKHARAWPNHAQEADFPGDAGFTWEDVSEGLRRTLCQGGNKEAAEREGNTTIRGRLLKAVGKPQTFPSVEAFLDGVRLAHMNELHDKEEVHRKYGGKTWEAAALPYHGSALSHNDSDTGHAGKKNKHKKRKQEGLSPLPTPLLSSESPMSSTNSSPTALSSSPHPQTKGTPPRRRTRTPRRQRTRATTEDRESPSTPPVAEAVPMQGVAMGSAAANTTTMAAAEGEAVDPTKHSRPKRRRSAEAATTEAADMAILAEAVADAQREREERALVEASTTGVVNSDIPTLPVAFPSISNCTVKGNALLDTGALGTNFISHQLAATLLTLGLAEYVNKPTVVCPAFGPCKLFTKRIKMLIGFTSERIKKSTNTVKEVSTTIEAVIVEDRPVADLIIGRDTIKELNLVRHARSHFQQISQSNAAFFEVAPLEVDRSGRCLLEEGSGTSCTCNTTGVGSGDGDHSTVQQCPCSHPQHTAAVVEGGSSQVGSQPSSVDASDATDPTQTSPEAVPRAVYALVVSKQHLLQDTPDDDEIEFPEIRFEEKEGFSDIEITDLANNPSFNDEQRTLLKEFFDAGHFRSTLQPEPMKAQPLTLEVDEARWYSEARNRQPPRPQSREKMKALFKMLNELLATDCIEPCQEPAYSQVHLVPKNNGNWRLCIDFRALNEVTKSKSWTIPNIRQMLQRLGDKKPKFFGVMDLTSGYFQAPIAEEARKYTAFRTEKGTFQWKRVPMGLKGAPSYFQEQMARIVGDLLYNGVEIYLDDLIVYGATEAEYLANLKILLDRLAANGVCLSPSKCRFGLREVEYVGHVINEHGKSFSQEKLTKVADFPRPKTQKQLKSFLGLANYFREHIRDHSTLVAPLHALCPDYRRSKVVQWTSDTIERFDLVKQRVAECQKLFWMDDDLPVFLHTDASDYGIGAYLFQIDADGRERPVHFLSKSFSDVQSRWSTIEKECYAIFYAFRELEHRIRDRKFTLRTDHRNLLFLNAQPNQKVTRWKLAIQDYDFDIEHIPGRDNVVADTWSRLCAGQKDEVTVSQATVAVCLSLLCPAYGHTLDTVVCASTVSASNSAPLSSERRIPSREFEFIKKCHGGAVGHHGVDRTLALVREALEKRGESPWPQLHDDVRQFVRNCAACQKSWAGKPPVVTEPFTVSSDEPMKRIAVDTLGPFPVDSHGNTYVISVIDTFSRYVQLFPAADCTAAAAAKAIMGHFSYFGVPAFMLSDNGPQYANSLINELATYTQLELQKTIAYSHEENSIVERVHKEVLRHLRTILYERTVRKEWAICLPLVQRILNATTHSTTGFAPAELITPAVPLNSGIIFPHRTAQTVGDVQSYITKLYEHQGKIIDLAQKSLAKKDATNMQLRKKAKPLTEFPVGSYVLLTHPRDSRAPSKLDSVWRGPYQVLRCEGNEYFLLDLISGKTISTHVSRLKPFHYDEDSTDLADIARRDSQQFIVQKVLGHNDESFFVREKDKLKFFVRWLGRGDEDNSWVSWKDLRNNVHLHLYLRDHGLKRYIPREHKNNDYLDEN